MRLNFFLSNRKKIVWDYLVDKYYQLYQSVSESKKKTLIKKFEKLSKFPLHERIIGLTDLVFRKKFDLNKPKKKFTTSYQLLKNYKFGQ